MLDRLRLYVFIPIMVQGSRNPSLITPSELVQGKTWDDEGDKFVFYCGKRVIIHIITHYDILFVKRTGPLCRHLSVIGVEVPTCKITPFIFCLGKIPSEVYHDKTTSIFFHYTNIYSTFIACQSTPTHV